MTEETPQDTQPNLDSTTVESALPDAPNSVSEPEQAAVESAEVTAAPDESAAQVSEVSSEPAQSQAAPAAEAEPVDAAVVGESATPATEAAVAPDASVDDVAASADGDAAPADGEEPGKKRRRRKRKKKTGGDDASAPARARAHAHDSKEGALARFLGERARRRHTVHDFSVGEVVAGIVEKTEDGAIVLDLFGKAMASVDELEPREVPALPEPTAAAPADDGPGEETLNGAPAPDAGGDMPESGDAPAGEAASLKAPQQPSDVALASASTDVADAATETAEDAAAIHAAVIDAAASDAAAEAESTEVSEAPDSAQAVAGSAVPSPEPEIAPEPPAIGSVFRGRIAGVAESGHIALVNRIIDRPAAKAAIAAARDEHRRVHGLVYGYNRGGFDVIIEGIRVFCPASGMSLTPIKDPSTFLGKKVLFGLPTGKTGRSIVVSRRSLLERDLRKQARARMAALKPGEKLHGHVTQVRDFGVLVDVGDGLEGLVHMSEISWDRGVRPADAAKPGDEVDVQVLKVQLGNRKDRYGKLSLSIKACLPDPWDAHVETLKVGAARKGNVTSTTDFGAFVQLAPGIEGLLHISELGGQDLKHANQVLKEGEELDVVIERIDRGQRRVSLSRLSAKDAQAIERGDIDPEKAPRSLKPGAHVTVVVERVERRGIKVQIQGVIGKRGRGFISMRDMGDAEGDQRKPVGVGTTLEVKVTGTDRDGTLRCSVRGKEQDEERMAVKSYRKEAAQQGFGTFGDLLRAKLGGDDKG